MSYRQRIVPLLLVTFVGVASGVYIFDPLIKQYAIDSRGTYDPKIAQAGVKGGIGGGLNDEPNKISQIEADAKAATKSSSTATSNKSNVISGEQARKHLQEALQSNLKDSKKE
ncbi:uncharacterized protein FA14DRAFT_14469 [Meira miltonrushii]|uniref:Uncharacterized protein n=1 Tax=Meira miltonrushii TaxID=1280837 RepID=A0A316VIN0_9BASI|nr:uncharacterized protein FA14DRAFT_14469 [Meira miltonrushii]PWN37489.1 hypothetical protein FA14DRAFT_14469 [Meira miltonrushii]